MSATPLSAYQATCSPFTSTGTDPAASPRSTSLSSNSPQITPFSRAISTDTTASAASSPSVASSASAVSSTSLPLPARTADVVEPAIVLQEETGLRAPPPNKNDAYLFFASSHTSPPGTLRTHPHAALPPARRVAVLSCPATRGPGCGGVECTKQCKQWDSIAAIELDTLRAALVKRNEADVDEQLRMLCGVVQRDDKLILGGENQLMKRLISHDAACARDKIVPLLLSHLSSSSQIHIAATSRNHAAAVSNSSSNPANIPSGPQYTDTQAAHTSLHLAFLFSYLTTGLPVQCQHLIGIGIVPHLTHLLASSSVHNSRTTECALTALGNLSADPSCRSVVVLSGVTDILMRLLIIRRRREHQYYPDCNCIDCRSLPSRRLCMWILSLLARSMCSSSTPHFCNALSPLVQPLCAMTEVEADADLCMHLLFFLYSVTTSTSGAYHFPLSPTQQSHHAELCAMLPLSVLPLLVSTLSNDESNLAYAALCIISNLTFASLALLTHLIESTRLIQQLVLVWTQLAGQSLTDISLLQRAQLNFVISCLAASPMHSHRVVLLSESRLIDAMVLDLSSSLLPISRSAAWAVANLTRGWWSVSRKDQDGNYRIEDGGRVMVETRERRRLLAEKPGLMRGLCSLLSVEYEDDVDHAELLHVALVAISNLVSDEWWVHDILRTEGKAGLDKAEAIRHSNSQALELALGFCSSPALHSHPQHSLPAHAHTKEATPPNPGQQPPPYSCFQSASLSYHASSAVTFPTAAPSHPPSSHPLTAAFLSHYGLALLARLEQSRLWYVRRWCVWMVCLFFTEYCNRHELHRQADYEWCNALDGMPQKEEADVDVHDDTAMEDNDADGEGSGGVLLDGPRGVVAGKRKVDSTSGNGAGNGVVHWHVEDGPNGSSSSGNRS